MISSEMDTLELEHSLLDDPLSMPDPFSSKVRVEFGGETHTGKVRKKNEDAFVICKLGRYWESLLTSLKREDLPEHFEDTGYSMAVADGIGGMAGGGVASDLAIRVCVSLVLNARKWAFRLDNPETRQEEIEEALKRVEEYFKKVDSALLEHAEKLPRLKGMGTTMTGAYSLGKDLFLVHVGDSRAYLFRNDQLQRMTRDHTVAQALQDAGQVLSESASRKLGHTLTSCLGGKEGRIQLEARHHQLMQGDRLLICTDGLTEMLNDQEIADVLRGIENPREACQTFIAQALEKGGKDNVTVVLAKYTFPE